MKKDEPFAGYYTASDVASGIIYTFWRVRLRSMSVDQMSVLSASEGLSRDLVISTVFACGDGFRL